MVMLDQLRVEASIGGTPIPVNRRAGTDGRAVWQSEPFSLPGAGAHALRVSWFDMSGATELLLADFGPFMLDASSDRNISIGDANYNYEHDADGDGITNIAEIRNNTGPFDTSSPGTPPNDGGGQTVNVLVSLPSEIQAAPFVVESEVEADVVFISGNSATFNLLLTRNQNMYVGEFPSRASSERFNIFWYERIDGQRVELGTSLLRNNSTALASGSIRDESLRFVTTNNDLDGDGRNNLRERSTGTAPTISDPASSYNENQTACAIPQFAAEATGQELNNVAFSPAIEIGSGYSELVSLVNIQNTGFFQGHFATLNAGTFQMTHVAGPPSDSVIELWQRGLDGTLSLVERNDDVSNENRRASLSIRVPRGGFCFLFTRFRRSADGNFTGPLQPLDDTEEDEATIDLMFSFQ